MIKFEFMLTLLRCPYCKSSALNVRGTASDMICASCGSQYPISLGRPVLIRPDNEVFCQADYRNIKAPVLHNSGWSWQDFIPSPSVNLASRRVLSRVHELLVKIPSATVLVVGGGRQRQWLDESLGSDDSIRIVYSDIDIVADVDLFCDGHDLPFDNGAFDAIVTTAVLEHVLYPERVASEMMRVLKEGGLLYSELPFMQQVHEGAYDFTRYTMSGHRRLLNGVTELESGMVAGPGTSLVWAVEHFAIAFVVHPVLRKTTKAIVRLFFGWIKYFDLILVNNPEAMDGASCTYVLGRKAKGRVADVEIISRYMGADVLRHT